MGSMFAGRLNCDQSPRGGTACVLAHPFNNRFAAHVTRAARHSASTGGPFAAQLNAYLAADHDVVASPVRFTLVPCGLLLAIFFLYSGDVTCMHSLLAALVSADPSILDLKRPLQHWTRIQLDERLHATLLCYVPIPHTTSQWDVRALAILTQPPYPVDVARYAEQAWCDRLTILEHGRDREYVGDDVLTHMVQTLEWLRGRGWVDKDLRVLKACAPRYEWENSRTLVMGLVEGYYATVECAPGGTR
ncbi:hypothetical protein H9P43_008835 [Blastocladiella emersonii ATCC 22665]|nr:hypothetical protein H9P43_008835 [Blastocladiella emersonii ATCC 22665]